MQNAPWHFGRPKRKRSATLTTPAPTPSPTPLPSPTPAPTPSPTSLLNPLAAIFAARSALLESDVGRAFGTGLRAIEQQLAQRGIERSGIGVGALLDFVSRAAEQLVTGRQRIAEDIAQQQFSLLPRLAELAIQREVAGLQALAGLGRTAQQQIIQAAQSMSGGVGGLAQLLAFMNMPTSSAPTPTLPIPSTPVTTTLPPNWWLGRV